MHVLVASVSSALSPGGVCRHAANIVRGLISSPSVTKVTMMTGSWQTNYFRTAFHIEDQKLEIKSVAIRNSSLSRNLWYLFGLPRAARARGADIVHLAYPMPILRGRFFAPVVLSLHDLYPFQIPENFGGHAWFNRASLHIALNNSRAVACVSEETRSALHQFFPKRPLANDVVIPNSIFLPRVSRSVALPRELRDAPFLLCVAQHRANKNIPLLLRTLGAALDRGIVSSNTKLVLLGREGPESSRLHQLVRQYRIDENVVFLSGISDELLSTLYAKSELVLAPSLLEGYGLPVAEALDSGGRVVCSDIPAFRSLGEGRCEFFDPADQTEESFLLAIQRARGKPRINVSTPASLNPEQAGAIYVALYDTLLDPHKARRYVGTSRGRQTAGSSISERQSL